MKYWIFKIVGILGLVVTPIILDSFYNVVVEMESLYARRTWYELCTILLVVFLVITLAGFARSIAKIKAWIDFHTDFDDDQELDNYPGVKIYAFVKKIAGIVLLVAIIAVSAMNNHVEFVTNNYGTIIIVLVATLLLLFVANIVICLIMRIVPLHYDMAVVLGALGFIIEISFIYLGIARIYSMLASVPFYAFAALYFSTVFDEFITIDEVFDWLCDDMYDEYYKKLCDKEKAKNAEKELSANKQAKQKKIENKPIVRAERKEAKQVKKTEKKTAKQTKKTNKKTLEKK